MMKSPSISVIVPVYNAEQYIRRCVDSILNQTCTDFELILVDDGSKDKSPQICDEYASQDTRVRVIHKANGGVSSARNNGLSSIKGGEYVAFIDADDYVVNTYLECLIANAEDADMVVCGFKSFHQGEENNLVLREEYIDKLYDESDIGDLLSQRIVDLPFRTPWAKLFRNSLLVDHEITYDESMKLGEDTKFVFEYMSYVSNIKTISMTGYLYRQDVGGNIRRYLMPMSQNYYCMSSIMNSYDVLKRKHSFTCVPFETDIRRIFSLYGLLYYQNIRRWNICDFKEYRTYIEYFDLYGNGKAFEIIKFLEASKHYTLLFIFVICLWPIEKAVKQLLILK